MFEGTVLLQKKTEYVRPGDRLMRTTNATRLNFRIRVYFVGSLCKAKSLPYRRLCGLRALSGTSEKTMKIVLAILRKTCIMPGTEKQRGRNSREVPESSLFFLKVPTYRSLTSFFPFPFSSGLKTERHVWLANDVVMPVISVLSPSPLVRVTVCPCGAHAHPQPVLARAFSAPRARQ